MERTLILLVVGQLVISAAAALAPRLKIPAPLILVFAGIAVSFVPAIPDLVIDPHVITLGLLPPLLYASATRVPVMNFRRELNAISGLSVVLVVLSALALGALFVRVVPGLSFGWGVALGAVISPTDAVATSIIKGRGVPTRVSVILEGEGLLNDATALTLLRTAIVATSLGFSFWPTVGNFALSIVVAIVVGILAANINLAIRKRIREEAVNTLLSFTTPFLAAVPAEFLHGSGLVAAVVAGLIVGARASRHLPPGHRFSDAQNWATVEVALEGVVFLTMGLQLSTIVRQLTSDGDSLGGPILISVAALVITIVVRAAYVGPLMRGLRKRALRYQTRQPEVEAMQRELEAGRIPAALNTRRRRNRPEEKVIARLSTRVRIYLADLDYLARQPLGSAETSIVIWAGMRGAVTVAAAQLLPEDAPHRPLLVFIAFAVASFSLVLQGGSIGMLVRVLFPGGEKPEAAAAHHAELARIRTLCEHAAADVPATPDEKEHKLAVIRAKRRALIKAADEAVVDAESLQVALRDLDIDEMVLELRTGAVDGQPAPSS